MLPKCARLLRGARPSANADATRRLGARAVRGPSTKGTEEERAIVHQQVRDAYAG